MTDILYDTLKAAYTKGQIDILENIVENCQKVGVPFVTVSILLNTIDHIKRTRS